MPPDRSHKPRQEPVSCQLCRSRKLKCSRQQPCSNCEARGVLCIFHGSQPPPNHQPRRKQANDNAAPDFASENASIKARLARLEAIVLDGKRAAYLSSSSSTNGVSPNASPDTFRGPQSSPKPYHLSPYQDDTRFLEYTGTQEQLLYPQLDCQFKARISPLSEIAKLTRQKHDTLMRHMPEREVTLDFYESYVQNLDVVQHVIHPSTVRTMINNTYLSLTQGLSCDAAEVALIMSILASSSYYWVMGFGSRHLFTSSQQALRVSSIWAQDALDCLSHAHNVSSGSVPELQTSVIMLFLLYHLEGFSTRVRLLHADAHATARDMGLHKTDCYLQTPTTQQGVLDLEIRRRVWWQIVASDWQMAATGGPQEGSYTVNPNHMRVNIPRNITDDDLLTQPADFTRPITEPTQMAYYLQRIKIAEVCRTVVDWTWDGPISRDPAEIDYDVIKSLDTRFKKVLDELPVFLKLDPESRDSSEEIDRAYPYLAMQRSVVNLMLGARRCKLHLPFLGLVPQDEKYQFSREICLQSARHILHIRKLIGREYARTSDGQTKYFGALHHLFFAAIVLVMDLCVNKNSDMSEEQRIAEVRDGCRLLEDAKEKSALANVFLESLTSVLKKHDVKIPLIQGQIKNQAFTTNIYGQQDVSDAHDSNYNDPAMPVNAMSDFDEAWESFLDTGLNLEPHDWNALFSDLELRIG
ncbi:hypothetical protein K431DRAFT_232806 [Polychaeton citri CBS 116435]|uniref:Zn(2)-C6 fungal-type domain-containing protein n=1 Tax=Polychaeton citri CBS 116435 TaxID=1314669 RepID=A0A9P4ULR5_9PEZI|nr:hypothetical protein K431DRAFT_232806 [Polychaeton citri CBS 116435]